ncbi:hypothetical protein I6A81_09705, partial [Frankia sp. CN7]
MTGVWRRVRLVALCGLGLGSAGLAAVMVHAGSKNAVDIAAIAGLFVTIAGLALAVADYLRSGERPRRDLAELADDLTGTLRGQWVEEAAARRLRDPGVLPLSWSATRREVADPRATATRDAAGRVTRLRLDGRLEGRFEEVTRRLADGYQLVPSGRMVVLGEPGAGKTVLAILLTLGLLDRREAGGPVPVLVSASSWDPVTEALDRWLVRDLAVTYYSGRPEVPRLLWDAGLLLPVLDGLDEIPESARRSAVRAVNQTVGRERPVVVTCRAAEYEDVIEGGAPVLRGAPVVEVAPLPAEDVIAYLTAVDWPEGTSWERVFARLRDSDRAESPVRAALSTPLMVSIARLVYQRCGGDPGELLDPQRYDCRHAVEDRLTDLVIDAAYAPDRLPSGQPVAANGRWDAERARRWLMFLARYVHQHRDRDLAWWQMPSRLLSAWAIPALGIVTGVAVMTLVATVAARADGPTDVGGPLAIGAIAGAGFAVLSLIVWYASPARAPGRLSFAVDGSLGRLRRGFATGFALTGILTGLPLTAIVVIVTAAGGWTTRNFLLFFEACGVAVALAILAGLAIAAHNWLDAPPERPGHASPASLLRQDRRSALAGALAAGLTVAIALPALATGEFAGGLLGRVVTGWPGRPGEPDLGGVASLVLDRTRAWDDQIGVVAFLGLACLLPGAAFAVLVLLTRAWPRFLIARLLLAAGGHLPWRLLDFLTDARDRGLLRQAGGTYQFRHVRLQERLANQALTGHTRTRPPASPVPRAVPRRLVATAAASAIAITLAFTRPIDASARALDLGGPVVGVELSPNDEVLAVVLADGGGLVWDLSGSGPPRLLLRLDDGVWDWRFSADGEVLVVRLADEEGNLVDGETLVWDLSGSGPPRLLHGLDDTASGDPVLSVDGEVLAVRLDGGEALVWDPRGFDGPVFLGPLPELDGAVRDLVFSAGG